MAAHSGIIFFKELTDNDVKKRLVVPKECQDFFLPSYGRLPAKIKLMYDGKIWEVKCTVRTKGYLKPILSVGWKMFVVANELKVGDRITMCKDEDGFFHYVVEVEKPPAGNQHGTLPNSPAPSFIHHKPDETTVEYRREVPEDLAGAHHQPDIAPMNMPANAWQSPSIGMFGTNMNGERAHFSPMTYAVALVMLVELEKHVLILLQIIIKTLAWTWFSDKPVLLHPHMWEK
ncbi:hypothetical protein ES319_A04G161500v1 [Gossypium barbadense]|uniref:TF-B3 domain-containing protein n=2 Tax=Gossypium TaxID=3633 RepID=A0A5J5W819_GOSBA|nr:hypothetical protein ES319_A04G161500v1 [Gossypium barbadense]TYH23033.1 hypothetical protein ES288_A04G177900v1 [Gossypium darwinii]